MLSIAVAPLVDARGRLQGRRAALTLSARAAATAPPAPTGSAPQDPATGPQAPTTAAQALEAGDLHTARTLAVAERNAAPSAASWRTEAEVHEALGDYAAAAGAYDEVLAALGPDDAPARDAALASRARVLAQSRGTVAGEPVSTHREALDKRWVPPPPEPAPPAEPKVAVVDDDLPQERVIDKWYFWVTIGAIAASAAAVAGIAIRASRDEQPDALGLSRAPTRGPTMLRF